MTNVNEARGIDNLLYSSDVDFSCFADMAVVSPVDYRKEGEGSLMQVRSCILATATRFASDGCTAVHHSDLICKLQACANACLCAARNASAVCTACSSHTHTIGWC